MFNKRLLKRVQIAVYGKAFDGGDAQPTASATQEFMRSSIDQNRASATGSLIASLFCAGEAERVAEEVGSDVRMSADVSTSRPLIVKCMARLL
ncbi:hypothetical protein ASC97_29070 [Rhizobium sp. Root1203]|nr:hypothetical protein ASC97_29070 [Rhizobium sp. Root1203]